MNKKVKIIVILVLIFLALIAYLTLTLKEVTVKPKVPQSHEDYARQVEANKQKVMNEYKLGLKNVFLEYNSLNNNSGLSGEEKNTKLLGLRDELKVMTVPAEYKDMHMNLFLAYSKLGNTEIQTATSTIEEISNLMSEASTTNSWLSQ